MLRTILVFALYGTGTLLSLHGIAYACSFFIWSEIFRPLDFSRRVINFPVAHLVTIMLLLSITIHKWRRRWNPVATVLCILIGWAFLSTIFSQIRPISMFVTTTAIKYLIPLVVISISLVTRFSQNLFVFTLAASVGIWSAQAGLHCLLTGNPEIGMRIPGGQMTERNDFMVGAVSAIPLIAYAGWAYCWRYQRVVRWIARAALLLTVVAVFFSLSRGAVVGITCLLFYYAIATGRFGRRFVIGAFVVGLAVVALPSFVSERMGTIDMSTDYQSDSSAASRLNLLKVGVRMSLDHPIVGVGPGNFRYMSQNYGHWQENEPHSIWLKASAEYGFPVLILFTLLFLLLVRRLSQEAKLARLEGDRESELLATSLACSLVGFLATATFSSQFLSEFYWAICAVSGAFLAHRAHQRRTEQIPVTREPVAKEAPMPPAPAAA